VTSERRGPVAYGLNGVAREARSYKGATDLQERASRATAFREAPHGNNTCAYELTVFPHCST